MDDLEAQIRGRIVPLTRNDREDLQFKIEKLLESFIEMKYYLDERFNEMENHISNCTGGASVEWEADDDDEEEDEAGDE